MQHREGGPVRGQVEPVLPRLPSARAPVLQDLQRTAHGADGVVDHCEQANVVHGRRTLPGGTSRARGVAPGPAIRERGPVGHLMGGGMFEGAPPSTPRATFVDLGPDRVDRRHSPALRDAANSRSCGGLGCAITTIDDAGSTTVVLLAA